MFYFVYFLGVFEDNIWIRGDGEVVTQFAYRTIEKTPTTHSDCEAIDQSLVSGRNRRFSWILSTQSIKMVESFQLEAWIEV